MFTRTVSKTAGTIRSVIFIHEQSLYVVLVTLIASCFFFGGGEWGVLFLVLKKKKTDQENSKPLNKN